MKLEEVMDKLFADLKRDSIVSAIYEYKLISEAEYNGRKVKLNSPFRESSGGKKFAVYVKNKKGNVIKVRFGAKGYRVKNNNKKDAKKFKKRHKCSTKKDKTKAGYWACNIGRYAKKLGLSSSKTW